MVTDVEGVATGLDGVMIRRFVVRSVEGHA